MVYSRIAELLSERNIDLFAPVRLSDCKITKKYLIDKAQIDPANGSAIIMAVPYLVNDGIEGNISEYAKSRDYHLFFSSLFEELIKKLTAEFPDCKFAGFTDHSPIDEINAAAIAGLGIIGANGLLITEKYSSFVFLGEIITNAPIQCVNHGITLCEQCSACLTSCPAGCDKLGCLSAITQKKGELTEEENELILANGSAWGCDICQRVCPHTKRAVKDGSVYSKIDFFAKDRTPRLTYKMIEEMSEEEFKKRAYSWRGKSVLLRNLRLFENLKK